MFKTIFRKVRHFVGDVITYTSLAAVAYMTIVGSWEIVKDIIEGVFERVVNWASKPA